MLSYRFSSNSILYEFIIFLFVAFALNCGLALGYQAEEEAAQASQENNNSPVLAALGLSSGGGATGGGASSMIGFSPSNISFTAASGKTTYSLTIATWPLAGSGQIDLVGTWVPKTASCPAPSPNTVSMVSDSFYPIQQSGITFSCSNVGTGTIQYAVSSSFGTGAPANGTVLGTLNITITP
ncbi:hypothetical protein [Leptospira haakeii]|uniref:Uncharacterized protein n=1 Tax=Leptospira haakeii TaxID=2023198 RepID=A0ABX4PR70_9LEPT|nr:hypothetical protein [Leptospira haakeii]PKA16564.1 hypothetical protein CH363_07260 [Leptospira haakeii]PKA20585.1 hypothetical protein CH377_06665 [Leptospira haakeii]